MKHIFTTVDVYNEPISIYQQSEYLPGKVKIIRRGTVVAPRL